MLRFVVPLCIAIASSDSAARNPAFGQEVTQQSPTPAARQRDDAKAPPAFDRLQEANLPFAPIEFRMGQLPVLAPAGSSFSRPDHAYKSAGLAVVATLDQPLKCEIVVEGHGIDLQTGKETFAIQFSVMRSETDSLTSIFHISAPPAGWPDGMLRLRTSIAEFPQVYQDSWYWIVDQNNQPQFAKRLENPPRRYEANIRVDVFADVYDDFPVWIEQGDAVSICGRLPAKPVEPGQIRGPKLQARIVRTDTKVIINSAIVHSLMDGNQAWFECVKTMQPDKLKPGHYTLTITQSGQEIRRVAIVVQPKLIKAE
ncbi:MAG: hypothetical protein R3C20_12265 [Planctomycetaceae bacterium]